MMRNKQQRLDAMSYLIGINVECGFHRVREKAGFRLLLGDILTRLAEVFQSQTI